LCWSSDLINYFLGMMADQALDELMSQVEIVESVQGVDIGAGGRPDGNGSLEPNNGEASNESGSDEPASDGSGQSGIKPVPASKQGGGGTSAGTKEGVQGEKGSSSAGGSSSTGNAAGTTSPETTSEADLSYSAEITPEKAEKVREAITLSEKAKLARVILTKFGPDELSLFIQLAQGGLTVEEKKKAKKLFLEKLTAEEYDELIAIAAKYGLSQGKSYEESLRTERFD
jgi:hypothetical protein